MYTQPYLDVHTIIGRNIHILKRVLFLEAVYSVCSFHLHQTWREQKFERANSEYYELPFLSFMVVTA